MRIEYRPPYATCNIYLAMSAQLLAGLDGIINKIDPISSGFGPGKGEREYKLLPFSLSDAIKSLKNDYKFLLQGNVFPEDPINFWIEYKEKEIAEIEKKPLPIEFEVYNDI